MEDKLLHSQSFTIAFTLRILCRLNVNQFLSTVTRIVILEFICTKLTITLSTVFVHGNVIKGYLIAYSSTY